MVGKVIEVIVPRGGGIRGPEVSAAQAVREIGLALQAAVSGRLVQAGAALRAAA